MTKILILETAKKMAGVYTTLDVVGRRLTVGVSSPEG